MKNPKATPLSTHPMEKILKDFVTNNSDDLFCLRVFNSFAKMIEFATNAKMNDITEEIHCSGCIATSGKVDAI